MSRLAIQNNSPSDSDSDFDPSEDDESVSADDMITMGRARDDAFQG